MRRWMVLATAALFVWAPNAAAAQSSAAPDPVQALKKQFRAERGVDFTEISRQGASTERLRRHAQVQFGSGGPVAAYVIGRGVVDDSRYKDLESEAGLIVAGHTLYLSDSTLVKDKNWVGLKYGAKLKAEPAYFTTAQTINVFDPAVLKVTLKGAKAKPVSGGYFYQGDVTYAELSKVNKSYYVLDPEGVTRKANAKTKIEWRLWTDGDGLIQRLSTKTLSTKGKVLERVDTRYSDWGRWQIIAPPAADEVIDYADAKKLPRDQPDPNAIDLGTP
ncbi:hypothetical protein [Nonomuraea glycinis]|uniref:hypothetical protein n=1 Tax=Nonomuraea glycinis TaxID=2047744 RepID=UPI002E15140A|nr:hypothetical protein OHA68_04470 [Nonomuraea glycinis]